MQHLDELNAFQMLEIRSSLPDELLMYADKLSMAHSLEARVPFLDRKVVEHAQRLGAHFKIRSGTRKWLHRKVCRNFLPPAVLDRPKRGFAVNVVDDWFRSTNRDVIANYLQDPKSLMYRLLDFTTISKMVENHAAGRQDSHKILFSLVVFEQWLRLSQT